jgi:hypothetical protein
MKLADYSVNILMAIKQKVLPKVTKRLIAVVTPSKKNTHSIRSFQLKRVSATVSGSFGYIISLSRQMLPA